MTPSKCSARDLWAVERELLAAGTRIIAGVDEAGRGPLAGPVVAAAVILPVEWLPRGLNDSKKLPPATRERLYEEIRSTAIAYSIQVVPAETIDKINILEATRTGMRDAIAALDIQPEIALIDGLPLPAPPVPQQNIIHGDAISASIAAASILAKVFRDRLMCALDGVYPGYGFAGHKGYPTAEHYAALRLLGPCPQHRRSFRLEKSEQVVLEL